MSDCLMEEIIHERDSDVEEAVLQGHGREGSARDRHGANPRCWEGGMIHRCRCLCLHWWLSREWERKGVRLGLGLEWG